MFDIGTDIVSFTNFKQTVERTPEFLDRYFTPAELETSRKRRNPLLTLAGIFAAKESLLKAFGVGLFESCDLHQIEVAHQESGKPYFKSIPSDLDQHVEGQTKALLSISHCDEFAVATVMLVTQTGKSL